MRERLQGGDRRQLGSSDAVASDILRNPEHFSELFEAILDDDPVVRMRAADATEKVTRGRPDLLVPFRKRMIVRLERLVREGGPAVQVRSRKLLARLSSQHAKRGPLKKNR